MLAVYGLLIARLCYLGCLLPQMWLTYKTKFGTALSDLLLLGYLNGYATSLFYIFCYNLPPAYKIITPLETLAVLVMIGQRLYYDTTAPRWLAWLYVANTLLFFTFIPWAVISPRICGNVFGWLTFGISAVNQLPQAIKIFRAKSVYGFSFLFVIFCGLATITELSSSIALSLPIQTIINALRGVAMFLVFCVQFAIYRK